MKKWTEKNVDILFLKLKSYHKLFNQIEHSRISLIFLKKWENTNS